MVNDLYARRPAAEQDGADPFGRLLELHKSLEHLVRRMEGQPFVSGWNADNPFRERFLGTLGVAGLDSTAYQSYTSDATLLGSIREMHRRFDGIELADGNILPGDGSTGLIATTFLWLWGTGVREVLYVPTVHDTFYYYFRFLGLEVRRAADRHPFEPGFELDLPDRRSVLFVSDPTWYVGQALADGVIDELARWQRATGSLVFVDGTWQYLQWGPSRRESSARLDPELTLRLVGPTKFLGLNGHRFSYLLAPAGLRDQLADVHENVHGSTSVHNLEFARRAIAVMNGPEDNRPLTDHVAATYRRLIERGLIETEILPDCGLYCFARPTRPLPPHFAMGGEYYELDGYPGYLRVNLLGGGHLEALEG